MLNASICYGPENKQTLIFLVALKEHLMLSSLHLPLPEKSLQDVLSMIMMRSVWAKPK